MSVHRKTLRILVLLTVLCGGLLGGAFGASGTAVAAPHRPFVVPSTPAELYRLWSGAASDHFYTTNWSEATNAFNNLGYTYEGVAARVDGAHDPGTVPLFRLYSGGASDHFYTTNWSEAVNAFNHLGYTYEGIQCYVWPSAAPGTEPLYRLYSGGATDHFYTTNWSEATNAFNNLGYTYEGIQAYVIPA